MNNCFRILTIFLVILLTSCNKKQETNSDVFFEKQKTITVPMTQKGQRYGYFVENGEEKFYSFNSTIYRFEFYDKKGNVIDSFPNAIGNLFIVKSRDSILGIDYNNNYLISHWNSRGDVIKEYNIHSLTNQDTLIPYLFTHNPHSFGKTLYTKAYLNLRKFSGLKLSRDERIERVELSPPFAALTDDFVYFAKDLTFSKAEEISGKNSTDIGINYSSLAIMDKHIVYTINFINQLFIFDKDGNYKKSITITSDYTNTDINKGFSFYDYYLQHEEENLSLYQLTYSYASQVNNIIYNPVTKHLYVLLIHQTDITNPNERRFKRSNRDFSILVYDTDFNKIAEQKFSGRRYNLYNSALYISPEGHLLIDSNYELNEDFIPNTIQYDVFKEIN